MVVRSVAGEAGVDDLEALDEELPAAVAARVEVPARRLSGVGDSGVELDSVAAPLPLLLHVLVAVEEADLVCLDPGLLRASDPVPLTEGDVAPASLQISRRLSGAGEVGVGSVATPLSFHLPLTVVLGPVVNLVCLEPA